MAIQIQEGFQIGSANPLDSRTVVQAYSDLVNIRAYSGLLVYVKTEKQIYLYDEADGWMQYPVLKPKYYSLVKETISVSATTSNQKTFKIPSASSGSIEDGFDVVIGSVFLSETRYTIDKNNNIVLNSDEDGIDIGRTVDFKYCYLVESHEQPTQKLNLVNTPKKSNRKKKTLK